MVEDDGIYHLRRAMLFRLDLLAVRSQQRGFPESTAKTSMRCAGCKTQLKQAGVHLDLDELDGGD